MMSTSNPAPGSAKRGSLAIRFVVRIVDFAGTKPWIVLTLAALVLALTGWYARGIDVRSDLAELLPRDSPAFKAFEHQAGRAGGSSMLIVIVSSPDRAKNERYVDALAGKLEVLRQNRPDLVSYVESGTRDIRAYYEANKWLYADLEELTRIDDDLDRQIAIRSGLVEDLSGDGDAEASGPSTTKPSQPHAAPPKEGGAAGDPAKPVDKKDALGMSDALSRWKSRVKDKDSFPTGYFSARDGTLLGVRIASNASLGGAVGDQLLGEVQKLTSELANDPESAGITVGFTGDIASAAGEKKALVSEAIGATAIAIAIILIALVVYFRSLWSLLIIGVPVAIGVSAAYAFARFSFGYVNAAGAFLGAIIVGNGINYPIVLFARYREFRSRGMEPAVARREAVVNALRAELVGACVAAIAYGSLAVTQFRGFRQFGLIGFVGMLLVWASIVPIVPALITVVEPFGRGGARRASPAPRTSSHEGWIARKTASLTTSRPRLILAVASVLAIVALVPVPGWIVDPWEYDFGKLGSRSSDVSGAGEWSNKANEVFGGKMNIAGALMIADSPEQVPVVKKQILANDAADPKGRMIAEIVTVDDALPGTTDQQREKLEVLERIRSRLTPRVMHDLSEDERRTVNEARPPESLRVLGPTDLPGLLRRRFTERSGAIGTVFYVKPKNEIVFADGHNHMRLSKTTDNVRLPDGTVVMTASRSTIFAEMLASLRRDGPLASGVSLIAVAFVVIVLSRNRQVAIAVLGALLLGVIWLFGGAAAMGARLNYVNFIALPITFGIGCEYPFNLADRVRLLKGDVPQAVARSSGAVLLCSFTTIVGYGSLMLSDFQALESFGKLAVLGELACVFAAVFVMPSALVLLGRRRDARNG